MWSFGESEHSLIAEEIDRSLSIADVHNLIIARGKKTVRQTISTTTELTSKKAAGADTINVKSNRNFNSAKRVLIGRGNKREVRTSPTCPVTRSRSSDR